MRWYHAFAVSDQGMRAASLDERRVERPRLEVAPDAGWHLSYFMSLQDIRRKARLVMSQYNGSSALIPNSYLDSFNGHEQPWSASREQEGRVSSLWPHRA